ncbi:hypothetical protein PVAP13_9NG483114 [Panicum virgatum]|uniref:Uncharacterized protein n=1 Tax=Panicum virgatum TaxID=38727 RepID=A0A8T0MPP3_PANVG|nr:hypothetical protein PVAP13_9NG483114 [Panicum virgatum]
MDVGRREQGYGGGEQRERGSGEASGRTKRRRRSWRGLPGSGVDGISFTVHPLGTWTPFDQICAARIRRKRSLTWSLSLSGPDGLMAAEDRARMARVVACSTAAWGVVHAGFHHRSCSVARASYCALKRGAGQSRILAPSTRSSVAAWTGIIQTRRPSTPTWPWLNTSEVLFGVICHCLIPFTTTDMHWLALQSLRFLAYQPLVSRVVATRCVQGSAAHQNPQKRKWTSATESKEFGGGEPLESGGALASRVTMQRKHSWRLCSGRHCPRSLLLVLAKEGSLNLNIMQAAREGRSGQLLCRIGPRDSG